LETIFAQLGYERYPMTNECLTCNFTNLNAVQQYNFAKEFKNNYFKSLKDSIFMDEELYYTNYPFFVIDCSKQSDMVKNTRPTISITFKFSENVPANTKCYCLILCDSLVKIDEHGRVKVEN
jgi:hypothetical protein